MPHRQIQGYSIRSIHFQKCILQKLLRLNPCPVYGWKGNLSQSSVLNLLSGARTIILYAKGCVKNGGKRTGESFLRPGNRQDNVSVKCATTFSDTLRKESANQKFIYDWEKCANSWIIDLALLRHTWDSHRVLVRCENTLRVLPSVYIYCTLPYDQ
jgi:hypothetical protein